MRARVARIAGAVVVMGVALMSVAPAASAETTITPNPVPVSDGQTEATVTVNYTDGVPDKKVFFTQCRRSQTSPNFNPGIDCVLLTQKLLNISQNPDGNGSIQMPVFRGPEPSTDESWGCFAPGDEIPAGYTDYSPCFIRVSFDFGNNLANAQEASFTFTDAGGQEIPDASVAVVVPVIAVLVAAGGYLYLRRRRPGAVAG